MLRLTVLVPILHVLGAAGRVKPVVEALRFLQAQLLLREAFTTLWRLVPRNAINVVFTLRVHAHCALGCHYAGCVQLFFLPGATFCFLESVFGINVDS